jgi:hypothetical protein
MGMIFRASIRHIKRRGHVSRVKPIYREMDKAVARARAARYESTEIYSFTLEDKRLMFIWVIFGIFGGHKFRTGKYLIGVLYFLTMGGGLILWFYDGVRIARGDFKYKSGLTGRETNPQNLKPLKFN